MAAHSDKAAERGEPGYVWRSGQERRLAMVERWAGGRLAGRVFDNGCGLGTWLQAFGRYGRRRIGLELEPDRAVRAMDFAEGVVLAVGESLPFADHAFDFILSNEVLEHVVDDRQCLAEMVRTLKPGGRVAIFCPNRWYPVEQHGIYWRGRYHFGNIPLVNYLPTPLRNRLAPHVRAYTARDLRRLTRNLPVRVVHHTRIFGGYDNIEFRLPRAGRRLKKLLYLLELTPFNVLALSHFLVLEKLSNG